MFAKLIYFTFISIISFSLSKSIPHFIYDGIESFHDCSSGIEKISFSIYGTLTEKSNLKKMKVFDYLIEDMGYFKCSLEKNENSKNKNRKNKIYCQIEGLYQEKGYILEEPKVSGFDFNKENGESSWPKNPERKTFLIGKCGKKEEINDDPILFGLANDYVDPLKTVRKGIVDEALGSLPKRTDVDLDGMYSAMKFAQSSYSLNEEESAYLVYKWIGTNIEYDCYGLNHGGTDFRGVVAYNKGKGVCSGYSSLFYLMCNSLGLEVDVVRGYAKGASYIEGVVPISTNHDWNVVKLGASYYLVDSTWGAGSCKGDNFIRSFGDLYFCDNPYHFILEHYPVESKWQLISPTISLEAFVFIINEYFFRFGFNSIYPDKINITSTKSFKIVVTYEKDKNMIFIPELHVYQDDTDRLQLNACIYSKGNGTAEITCLTNYKDPYFLRLFGGPIGSEYYVQIVEYYIKSTEAATELLEFPLISKKYKSLDVNITEPLYGPLTKGESYNFKYISNVYDNLYINNGANNYIKLDKNGNEFSKNSVVIQGDFIYLCTLNNDNYEDILQYNTK